MDVNFDSDNIRTIAQGCNAAFSEQTRSAIRKHDGMSLQFHFKPSRLNQY
jgi:hypothetical protein